MMRFLTAGESHGKGLMVIIEGMVAGLPLNAEDIANELSRRQRGYGRGERMKIEEDRAEILSGVRYGLTTGSPIALFIPNKEWEGWRKVMAVEDIPEKTEPITKPRPGHADLAGVLKYRLEDIRPVMERASARETASRVAAGAVAKQFLKQFGIEIHSHTLCIGGIWAKEVNIEWETVERSPLRCRDPEAEREMIKAIDEAKAQGDTLGGVFEVVALGVPIGLGSYVHWDKRLNGKIAQAIMSIPAVKGVEVGEGFKFASLRGSQAHDIIQPGFQRPTNRAGGIEGGISNGQPIIVRAVVKPIPTLSQPLPSIDIRTGEKTLAHQERSDICVVPAAGVIGEAMLALVLADAFLEKFGGDSLKETKANYQSYISSLPK